MHAYPALTRAFLDNIPTDVIVRAGFCEMYE